MRLSPCNYKRHILCYIRCARRNLVVSLRLWWLGDVPASLMLRGGTWYLGPNGIEKHSHILSNPHQVLLPKSAAPKATMCSNTVGSFSTLRHVSSALHPSCSVKQSHTRSDAFLDEHMMLFAPGTYGRLDKIYWYACTQEALTLASIDILAVQLLYIRRC